MHSYVSNVGLNHNPWIKVGFNKKSPFLSHLKKLEVPSISISSYPINARAVYITSGSIRSSKAHESHTEMVFLFLLHLFFCFRLLFWLALFYFAFCETQRKTSKMYANLQVFELFLFSVLRLT